MYGESKIIQDGVQYRSNLNISDQFSEEIYVSVYDSGTIMCPGRGCLLWHADHLPTIITEITRPPPVIVISCIENHSNKPRISVKSNEHPIVNNQTEEEEEGIEEDKKQVELEEKKNLEEEVVDVEVVEEEQDRK